MDTMPLHRANCREIQLIMKLKSFFTLEIGLNKQQAIFNMEIKSQSHKQLCVLSPHLNCLKKCVA